ncbi:ABC transporter permease [Candidatus Enterococcus ferrettii]|uniref:ABC-2 type transporter transmembrane domain-containing protein n=1 Tax=Candidatus Enterococcus ferrettii TaxID=2815324 RepID=A0ABV0EMN2_9ENTE|nr:ABC transporter permease [Enterococcus sp. 665A]MBO1339658.1 ABC transporter permease [Enterococcus sp. 665A]
MRLSIKKIRVLTRFKFKELFRNKTFLITSSMVPLLTLIMRFVYQNILEGAAMPPFMIALVLNLGLLMNLTSVSMMMPATMLAKDKEKNTLRTLMTSSVNGAEYFISSVLPSFVVSFLINLLVLLLSGINLREVNVGLYLLVTAIAGLTSCVLGMLIGLFAKNQMSSSNICTIFVLVLMMVPVFGNVAENFQKISGFLYTGIVGNLVSAFAEGTNQGLTSQSWLVLIGELLIISVLFVLNYRKNGFEQE